MQQGHCNQGMLDCGWVPRLSQGVPDYLTSFDRRYAPATTAAAPSRPTTIGSSAVVEGQNAQWTAFEQGAPAYYAEIILDAGTRRDRP